MKHLGKKILIGASFSLLIMSCGGTEDSLIDEQTALESSYDEQGLSPQTIKYEIKVADPQSAEEKVSTKNVALTMDLDHAATIANDAVPPPPMRPGANFLPGVHDVAPWLANYVGSYGLLPTRFAKEGPALYSLDVHPRSSRHLARSTDD